MGSTGITHRVLRLIPPSLNSWFRNVHKEYYVMMNWNISQLIDCMNPVTSLYSIMSVKTLPWHWQSLLVLCATSQCLCMTHPRPLLSYRGNLQLLHYHILCSTSGNYGKKLTHEMRTPLTLHVYAWPLTKMGEGITFTHNMTYTLSPTLSLPPHTQVEIVRNKSTETMSFLLMVMSLLTTASWSTYGSLIHDIYAQISV